VGKTNQRLKYATSKSYGARNNIYSGPGDMLQGDEACLARDTDEATQYMTSLSILGSEVWSGDDGHSLVPFFTERTPATKVNQ
jgi:hypothetical protein